MTEAYPLAWPEGWPRTPWSQRGKSRFGRQTYNRIKELQKELRASVTRNRPGSVLRAMPRVRWLHRLRTGHPTVVGVG